METTITQLEKEILKIIYWGEYYKGTPAECFKTIMESFKGSKNQLKGILGSLIKKKKIFESKYPNGLNSYHYNTIADVIYCHKSNKHYFDIAGIIKNFEEVILENVRFKKAQEKYPKIVNLM